MANVLNYIYYLVERGLLKSGCLFRRILIILMEFTHTQDIYFLWNVFNFICSPIMKNIEGRTKKQWEKKAVDILEIINIWT